MNPYHRSTVQFRIILLLTVLAVADAVAAGDPSQNPAYAKYDFGDRQRVVTFGSQPLGIMAAVVPEVMRRDRILARYLSSRGLEFRVLPFSSGPDINEFIRQGKIDMAMAGDFPVMNIASTGDIQIVAISKRDKASIITHGRYSNIKNLVGKRIAFPGGTSSHLGLLVVLEAAGLRESDVKMLPMDIGMLNAALQDGRTDAISAWEPVPSISLEANKSLKAIAHYLNTDFFYWSGSFARKNPDVALHLLAAYIRALHWLNENDSHIIRAAAWSMGTAESFLGTKPKITMELLKRRVKENLALIGSSAIPSGEFGPDSYMQRAFELLRKKELIPRQSSWERIQASLKSDLVNEVLSNRSRYKTHIFDYPAE